MTPAAHERLLRYVRDRVPGERLSEVTEAAGRCLRTPPSEQGPASAKRSDQEIQLSTVALLAKLEELVGPDEFRQVLDIALPSTPAVSFDAQLDAVGERAGVLFGLERHRAMKAEREVGVVLGMDEARQHAGDAAGLYMVGCRHLGADVGELDYRSARDTFRLCRQIRSDAASPGLAMDAAASQSFAARFGVKHAPRVI